MSLVKILAAAVAAGAPLMAQASLIGDEVTIEWMAPDASSVFGTETVTAAAGPDLTCGGLAENQLCVLNGYDDGTIVFDIEASSVGMVFSGGTATPLALAFNGPRFSDLDFGAPITSVSLLTTIPGLDASRVAFGADWVSVNLSGLLLDSLAVPIGWSLELTAEDTGNGGGTDVPAPPILGLLIAGMAGIGMTRRRRYHRS